MKKIFAFLIAALALASCKMDFYQSDSMTSSQLKDNPASAVYTTDGIYSMFKDAIAYKGESEAYPNGRNQYMRHYFQITELRSDNVTISGVTSDPFIHPYDYADVPTEENMYYTWWMAYKIIYAANSNIDAIEAGASPETDHMLGENYFFRALAHFHLVTLYAMPYVCGVDNPGVILHQGMDSYSSETVTRAKVGDVYEAVVNDLKEAIKFMTDGAPRGDHSYVSVDAAKALLARVYLYMEKNQECLDICNDLMGHIPAVAKSGDYGLLPYGDLKNPDQSRYPSHTYNSDETIWCVKMDVSDKFFVDHPTSSISSMYFNNGDQGWGEHYWSDILIDLFQRYPEDKRFAAYFLMPKPTNDGKLMVTFPIKTKDTNKNCSSAIVNGLTPKADGSIEFTYEKKTYTAVPTTVNTYTEYYVNDAGFPGIKVDGKARVFVRPAGGNVGKGGVRDNGGQYAIYYNTKFAGQDGQAMLTSPVFLRWGEVILNRAEAEAKLGQDQKALDDVNLIRQRAGLSGDALMTSSNYKARGYDSILDVVLDERRMELCFEGHRYFDVFRNRRKMDRRYVGYHAFDFIDYTDKRLALQIPLDEINSSGIEQNPR
jgi:hypothetical protein